jgi:hypothetical protein
MECQEGTPSMKGVTERGIHADLHYQTFGTPFLTVSMTKQGDVRIVVVQGKDRAIFLTESISCD